MSSVNWKLLTCYILIGLAGDLVFYHYNVLQIAIGLTLGFILGGIIKEGLPKTAGETAYLVASVLLPLGYVFVEIYNSSLISSIRLFLFKTRNKLTYERIIRTVDEVVYELTGVVGSVERVSISYTDRPIVWVVISGGTKVFSKIDKIRRKVREELGLKP